MAGGIISKPSVTIQLLAGATIDAFADRNDLIVGQTGPTGIAVDGDLNDNLASASSATLRTLLGEGELYQRVLQWQSGNDGFSPLSVIGLDADGGGTAATAILTITGPASADGQLVIAVVDEKLFEVTVAVTDTDTETIIADAITAAFNALETFPPFTVANVAGVVTFTALDVGTVGNHYSLKSTGSISGVTHVLTGWTGGATDPATTGIFDVIDGIRFTGISWPEYWQADIDEVIDELGDRFNPVNDILDGVAFTGHSDTFANDISFVGPLNSTSLVVAGNSITTGGTVEGSVIVQPADWAITYFMGVRAKRLTPNAPISTSIVAINAPLDSIGGPHLASLPYFNTPLDECPVTSSANQFSNTEQGTLAEDGFTVFGVNSARNTMIMGSVVTTRTTDAAGNVNDSFRFLNYVDTSSACREIFYNTLKAVFSQSRLAEGNARAGYSVANEETIRAELGNIYRALGNIVLVESGDEAERFFGVNTTVTINKSSRSVTITSLLPILTQLETINYPMTLTFTIESTGTQIGF